MVGPLGIAPAAASSEAPAGWSRSVRPVAKEVERLRGLRFRHPVPVRFVSRREFRKRLDAQGRDAVDAMDPVRRRASEAVLRAFGLMATNRTLAKEARSSDAGLVAAYYDPEREEIVVRGRDASRASDVLLAHELTHVLQDQHFGLRRLEWLDRPEERQPFAALTEGDAMRIANAYAATSSRADRGAMRRASPSPTEQHISLAAVALVGSPYVFGPGLVASLQYGGGERAINAAFLSPPDHTIEMMNPATLPTGVEPYPVPIPRLHRDEHRMGRPVPAGAFLMYLVLAARIDPMLALEAADEWNGGTVTAFRLGKQDCARATFAAPPDAESWMTDAWDEWQIESTGNGAHVAHGSGSVTVDACAAESAESDADPAEIITTVALRNDLLVGELRADPTNRDDAACVANSLLEDEAAGNALNALVDPDIPDGDSAAVLLQRRQEMRRECAGLVDGTTG
jgi:hypothetical protein